MAQDGDDTEAAAAATPEIVQSISNTRLHLIIVGLWLCLFISAMDTTIITTALIKISSSFHALDQGAWLVTAYLLTYNSFLMISAKLSDVLGLKTTLLACNVIFLVFSLACGGAKSMTQLIVFRAFQGIGGSGLYSLTFVAIMKLITPEKIGFYSGVISSVFAFANLLGPILGGLIADRTSWRVIFWINAPVVGISFALLFFAMPALKDGKSIRDRLRGFDGFGAILSVCWPVPLLFALQEAGVQFEWKSGVIIGTLITGLALLLLFGLYEAIISNKAKIDAMFPAKFATNPALALQLLSMLLLGMPTYVVFIQLPQRFQGVNFTSAERAGILLLPVTLLTPVGAMLSGALFGKKILGKAVATEYLLLLAMVFISIGIGLLSSLPVDSDFSSATYGYEIIIGFGIGFASPPYFPLLNTCVEEKDVAIGIGIMNMLRTLGGAIAVAICSALHHSVLHDDLKGFLDPEQIAAVEKSAAFIAQLPEQNRDMLGRTFGKSYNRQFQVTLAFSLLSVLVVVALIIVRKKKGIFGMMPVRREENEFMKKKAPVQERDKPENEAMVKNLSVHEPISVGGEATEISAIPPTRGDVKNLKI
ncbi:MFS general substrate transporter [Lentithecium fluviatile CBS 122367]|uniref:MFS general substrate transporter n=1 Tax=Lentithecium fluviatile CBS 122367 TaxID=1168545 RepID=A0A6G1J395_9PLEO|nr:MFS general substrate transporter [Lentithecium fluviatile CBS 122367]